MNGKTRSVLSQTDLHLHSSVSPDGEVSPRGMAELCCQRGVTLAALTDHNAVAGTEEFIWRSAQLGVRSASGIELDCTFSGQTLHLLGYGIRITDTALLHALQEVQVRQKVAGRRLLDAVEALGIRFDRERVLELAGDGAVCAEQIAYDALTHAENRRHPLLKPLWESDAPAGCTPLQFYRTLCAPGKPAHVPVEYMTAEQAVQLLHGAGGLAVLAHPGASLPDTVLPDALMQLSLDGIEAFSSYHTAAQAEKFAAQAQAHDLLLTGGSDFHGRSKPDIQVGDVEWLGREDELRTNFLAAVNDLTHNDR